MAALSNCTRQLEEAVANLGQEKHAARALATAWHATIEKALLASRQAKAGWMRVTGEGPMLAVDYFASMIEELREAKEIVDEAKDNATSGILDEWTDLAEQRAWFLFEAAREG